MTCRFRLQFVWGLLRRGAGAPPTAMGYQKLWFVGWATVHLAPLIFGPHAR